MTRLKKVALMVLALGVLLANSAPSVAAPKAGKKKKGAGVSGTILEVKQDGDKQEGTIKVSVKGKKKDNAPATEKTFKITSGTKIEKVAGRVKKGAPPAVGEAAKFSALAKDQLVTIKANGDTVEEIKFTAGKGKTKKKKKAA